MVRDDYEFGPRSRACDAVPVIFSDFYTFSMGEIEREGPILSLLTVE